MKSVLKALYMTFGMFTVIPAPKSWDEPSAKHMMPWLPLAGAVIGAAWWGAAELLVLSGLHIALCAAILMLIPFVLSGFIHLDGYMDTSDALLSRRSVDEKLRILKDPHTGAFAVIMIAVLFVLMFASAYALIERWNLFALLPASTYALTVRGNPFALLPVIPVLSRCCSSMAVLCLNPMTQGYAYAFKPSKAAPHRAVTVLVACAAFVYAWFCAGPGGLAVSGAVVAGYCAAMVCALSGFRFRGVSGDLVGFSLVIGELCGLFACGVI